MKTFFLLCITSLIGTGALLAALKTSSIAGYIVGFGVWILFFAWFIRKSNRTARRRHQERLFDEWLRSQFRNRRY